MKIVHPVKATFKATDWYWFVGHPAAERTQVYSSSHGCYVPVTDPTYQAWVAAQPVDRTTPIANEDNLRTVLSQWGLTLGEAAN
jgi:hypothetical protein